MHQYLAVLNKVLNEGYLQSNRTGVDTLVLPGHHLSFDLRAGFPAVTTKRLAFKQVVGELLGFISGYTNSADFRQLGCNVWDADANTNGTWLKSPHRKGTDDLGRIYSAQWRDWGGLDGKRVDQLANAINLIETDPTSRRIIVSAWKPDELDRMALPPCHVLFQFIVNVKERMLNLCLYQRSCDLFLGVPFNIASYSLLLSLVAAKTGYTPGKFEYFMADAHIYTNHVDQVKLQLQREPHPLPTLSVAWTSGQNRLPSIRALEALTPDQISLDNYSCHKAIKGEMATTPVTP